MDGELTAKLSWINPNYYLIYLNGRAWRVCHRALLSERWPGIKIVE